MADITIRVVDCYVFRQTDGGLRFLLLKRNKDKLYEHLWQGVAGKIEGNETASEAAIRELREETDSNRFACLWQIMLVVFMNRTKTGSILYPFLGLK